MAGEAALRGKYAAYPEYKDPGVEWLDTIPVHWKVTPIKHVLSTPITDGPHSTPNFIDEGIPFVSAEAVSGGYINFDKIRGYISEEDDDFFSQKYRPQKHDVYMIKSGATTGITAIVETGLRFNIWSPLAVMRCNSAFNPYFLLNSLRADFFQKSVQLSWTFGTQQNIGMSTLENLVVCYPPLVEQQKIANFLDHETAKIDTLIDKQQQLITLLKEKRQAVISHAVTKGLNPNAPMRDSGVEWLGEVPEHWKVARIKYNTNLFEQGWSPQCDSRPAFDGEYGVLKVGCVNHGTFSKEENKALPKELEPQLQYLLQKDDLLISRANTKELVGSAAVVVGDFDNLILCDKLYRLRFDKFINAQLIAYYLSLPVVRQQIEIEATGASHSMQNIGQSTIKDMPVVVPPIDEADELVLEIKKITAVFDLTLNRANEQITLLQERRTALISAAVTGKIDVRHWQAPAPSKNHKEVAA
jgi:type I restriction enzyme S subunit